jgi:CBS domain-containing protein
MKIGEYCNRDVVVAQRQMDIVQAARLMKKYHVGDLIVVEARSSGNYPVGVITDRDLVLEVLAQDVRPDQVIIGDIMSADIVTVPQDDGMWETLDAMRAAGVRRMPVVDPAGVLVGLATLDDLLEWAAEVLANITHLVKGELRRESRLRKG